MKIIRGGLAMAGLLSLALNQPARAAGDTPAADLVVTGGKIYTVDAAHSIAQAMAVRHGKIVFAGSAGGAKRFIGPHTKIEPLGGRLVLPGLFDSHIHPIEIIPVKQCDLDSAEKTLRELSAFVQVCVGRFHIPAGGWLSVHQWNFSNGNQPDADYPTLQAALDKASKTVAIQLVGNDGDHGAYNRLGMARAKN